MEQYLPLSYCAGLVRQHDHDRYLCALFAPAQVREAWFALFAFNHEIAIIAEIVSEEMIGFIRFAWWREALDEIYGNQKLRKHPVVEALAQTIHAHHLPRALLDMMLAARANDLEQEPFNDFAELENYCRDTSATLLQLCAIAAEKPVTPALEHLGVAWALIGIARTGSTIAAKEELLAAAEEHLHFVREEGVTSLHIFKSFYYAAQFYLKRLRSGKQSSRLRLTFLLWLKSLF